MTSYNWHIIFSGDSPNPTKIEAIIALSFFAIIMILLIIWVVKYLYEK